MTQFEVDSLDRENHHLSYLSFTMSSTHSSEDDYESDSSDFAEAMLKKTIIFQREVISLQYHLCTH